MRKRLMLLWVPAVVGIALMLPASTMAGSLYTYSVRQNLCQTYGGDHYNPYLKVKATEHGWSGADTISFDGFVDRRPLGGGSWTNIDYDGDFYHLFFPDDGRSFSAKAWYAYNGDGNYWYRVRIRINIWDGSYLLASRIVKSVKC